VNDSLLSYLFALPYDSHNKFLYNYISVAILAKNGLCSVETKARLASLSVEPPGRLKYLIVYGDNHLETPIALRPLDRDPEITVGILHVDEGSGRGTFVHHVLCVQRVGDNNHRRI
jgi:hypothetical protein